MKILKNNSLLEFELYVNLHKTLSIKKFM